ncbi:MAG: PhzF family phenazine biosynthesis protein [Deltaproteobacteria bacterium]|nr:PhzF family phenazine biosynthesis protein [Deltaproteobacteria bacterium]
MKIRYFHVDAFTHQAFRGNPAGVAALESWLPDETLQLMAREHGLPETAFFVKRGGLFDLRWYTPESEVDLCGHATLATAHVILNHLEPGRDGVEFQTKSGLLTVIREGQLLEMNFPSRPGEKIAIEAGIKEALGVTPLELYKSRDLMAVVESEDTVRNIVPNFEAIKKLDCLGVVVTAPSKKADFVSRFFAPSVGVPEDPVTGSAHCTLVPYWSQRLKKTKLHALQLSERGGELFCEHKNGRVTLGGRAVTYFEAVIQL